MSLEEDIREAVLGLDGVAAVYSADPLWLAVVKQVGALLSPGDEAAEVPFVVCTGEGTAAPETDDGASPAGVRQVMTVRVRIGTDGSLPAPATARAVAAAIRSLVSKQRPGLDVKAVVEVSAIGV